MADYLCITCKVFFFPTICISFELFSPQSSFILSGFFKKKKKSIHLVGFYFCETIMQILYFVAIVCATKLLNTGLIHKDSLGIGNMTLILRIS